MGPSRRGARSVGIELVEGSENSEERKTCAEKRELDMPNFPGKKIQAVYSKSSFVSEFLCQSKWLYVDYIRTNCALLYQD